LEAAIVSLRALLSRKLAAVKPLPEKSTEHLVVKDCPLGTENKSVHLILHLESNTKKL